MIGTLVYDNEIALPITSVSLSNGVMIFHGKQYFNGKVTLESGLHHFKIYSPDKSVILSSTVEMTTNSTVVDGVLIIEQPVSIN